ncbi:MAG: Uncharacterized protein LiPW15_138 [Parcubacteria group bacterium LiPW_15]|nr:MAG: Uncharacterized protein LiPW15_138 [Parcubacteria group bacterium LiPW_15]
MAKEKKDVVFFAKTDFRDADRIFGIKRADRRQHMYVIGKTGTGKTTLLRNMVIQDIANGEGLCVVDPHGEFVEDLLKMIPKDRLDDVVYFNPGDPDFHVGFNPLEISDPRYKHLVASGLMAIFTKIWAGVWSPRMEYILNNCVLGLLDTPGTTLLGIPRLLVDKEFRQKVVANIQDPVVKAFWSTEYEAWKDQYRNEAIAPIQNKVGQFLSVTLVRNIVGQQKSTVDFFEIMNSGKILLVNVSKGRIGEDNSALLGAMVITKIQLSAMDRIRVPEEERVDFYLYVDEFQNFATDSFANILSEARKYRLCLTMAHQYIGQLVTDVSTKVRDAIFGNVGTQMIMRVGAADADFLAKELEPEFGAQDMVNLPNRRIYLKLMVDGVTSRSFSAATLPPIKTQFEAAAEEDVIKTSRKRYARPRYAVEEEISEWSEVMGGPRGGSPAPRQEAPRQMIPSEERREAPTQTISLKELEGKETFPSKEKERKPVEPSDIDSVRKMISDAMSAPKDEDENEK